MDAFKSTIFIIPGLGNSGPAHWQSLWEKRFGFTRVEQQDWETPVCADWTTNLQSYLDANNPADVILVGHSLACATIAYWAKEYNVAIKAALLVAPSDTEADSYPTGTTGFAPVPLIKLPFKSITVTSTNDFYVSPQRAQQFAEAWGSKLVNIGDAAHINAQSNLGEWEAGLELLRELDEA
jgi:predicted alpha/beta hydrolase family esterase